MRDAVAHAMSKCKRMTILEAEICSFCLVSQSIQDVEQLPAGSCFRQDCGLVY